MKHLFYILALLFAFGNSTLYSQSTIPQGINYQAAIRNTEGRPVSNTDVVVELLLWKGGIGASLLWQETHYVTTNAVGLFSVVLGKGTSARNGSVDAFDKIDWAANDIFVEVKTNFGAGMNSLGATQLQSVPFAFIADSALKAPAPKFRIKDALDVDLSKLAKNKTLVWNGTQWETTPYQSADSIVVNALIAKSSLQINKYLVTAISNDSTLSAQRSTALVTERAVKKYVDARKDGDTSSSNELQTLSMNKDTIFLSKAGYVVLPKTIAQGISASDTARWNAKSSFSGSYSDLSNKPLIPTTTSQLTNDAAFIALETDPLFTTSLAKQITASDTTRWNAVQDLQLSGTTLTITGNPHATPINLAPYAGTNTDEQKLQLSGVALSIENGNTVLFSNWDTNTADDFDGDYLKLKNTPSFAKVASSGAYNDLSGTPNIPSRTSDLTNDAAFISAETDPLYSISLAKAITAADTARWNAKSSFSGKYADLQGKPTIPTTTSQLVNNSGFLTAETEPVFMASVAKGVSATDTARWNAKSNFSGMYVDLQNKPFIPTRTSDLTNDKNFLSLETDPEFTKSVAQKITAADTIRWNTQQDLQLIGSTLKITGNASATGINLAAFSGTNTDEQHISLTGNSLSIDNGNTVVFKNWDTLAADDFDGDYLKLNNKPSFATVATSGSYLDLNNMPHLITKTSELSNDAGFLTTESDPFFSNSVAKKITAADTLRWNAKSSFSGQYADLQGKPTIPTKLSTLTNDAGFLITESDPTFAASPASLITANEVIDWNKTVLWGNHAAAGYLKTETEPAFTNSLAKTITAADTTRWGAKSITETDPLFAISVAKAITIVDTTNWNTAFRWGNHALANYLKTETDPEFGASAAKGITTTEIAAWNNAASWGNHALAGYLTTETDPEFVKSLAHTITVADTSRWGNKSFTETDPEFAKSLASAITTADTTRWASKPTFGLASNVSDGLLSSADKQKLDAIEANAQKNVNADWDATSGNAQILHKPLIDGSETKITAGTNIALTGTGTASNPYVINHATTHYIGELFGGGVVFWVDYTGLHGLILSLTDVDFPQEWSSVTATMIGSTAQNDWNGLSNSNAIVLQAGHVSSAAQSCFSYSNPDYGTAVFSDWYLPSRAELNLLWSHFYEVQKTIDLDTDPTTTVLSSACYWSSNELDVMQASSFCFDRAQFRPQVKSSMQHVRAVRPF